MEVSYVVLQNISKNIFVKVVQPIAGIIFFHHYYFFYYRLFYCKRDNEVDGENDKEIKKS